MNFLSLGAGVQSSVMLMMAIKGDLPRPDHVIWSDTGAETQNVYRHVDWLEKQCAAAGLPFHRVKAKMTMLEEFWAWQRGDKDHWNTRPPLWLEEGGQFIRQCTRELKVRPVRRKMIELAQDKPISLWIGISTDEARRAAPSTDPRVDREYPLIDPLKLSRADCQAWWQHHYPHQSLPTSSCIICPYNPLNRYDSMSVSDRAAANMLDYTIRDAYQRKTSQTVYVAKDLQPVDTQRDQQTTLDLDDDIYCSGGCGL